MATTVAVIALLMVLVSIPLVLLKPHWVFYIFLASCLFEKIFYNYIDVAGRLGAPRTWTPSDMLVWLTLLAALLVPRREAVASGVIRTCLILIAFLGGICYVQGVLLNGPQAIAEARLIYFIAAMLFAMRYFTDVRRVEGFLRFTAIFAIIMFGIHLLIRLAIYEPPSALLITAEDQLAGERGEMSLAPLLYLAIVSIGIARFACKVRSRSISAIFLLVGLAGAILSETRTVIAGVVVMGLTSLLMVRGRMRAVFVYGLVILVIGWIAQAVGFDVVGRFRADKGEGEIVSPVEAVTRAGYRRMEYGSLADAYRQQPYFLFTGRGIGAMHYMPAGTRREAFVSGYHSDYLGWLDKFGLIGLILIIIVLVTVALCSFRLARGNIPYLTYYGVAAFVLTVSLVACGNFVPTFLHRRAGSFFICFLVIIANRQVIYESLKDELRSFEESTYESLTYSQYVIGFDEQVFPT